MAVLTNISTIAAFTQVSAVEIYFTTLASVGRTSLLRTATLYQLDYSRRSWRQSSHHRKASYGAGAGAGALCGYSKPLLNTWLS